MRAHPDRTADLAAVLRQEGRDQVVVVQLIGDGGENLRPSGRSQTQDAQRFAFGGVALLFAEMANVIDEGGWWHNRRWGVKALAAMGKKAEAIRYAEDSRGLNDPGWQIAEACEAVLLSSGLAEEAYRRYAIAANQGTTNLATFRAITKKYPHVPPEQVLQDLIAGTPGAEGKWFAAAKEAGMFELAAELAHTSPTDPRTLTRAARDFATEQPQFALNAALSALRWIARGHGYEITGADILDAAHALQQACTQAGLDEHALPAMLAPILEEAPPRHLLHDLLSPLVNA